MKAQEWLLDFVTFYRKLHFFEQHANLSDDELLNWLKIQLFPYDTRGDFDASNSWKEDYLFIGFDFSRVWTTSFDAYEGYLYEFQCLHEYILHGWAKISRGAFLLQDITVTWESEITPILINFSLDGIPQYIQLQPDDFYETSTLLKLAQAINPLISTSRYQYVIWDYFPAASVLVLTLEEKRIIEAERGYMLT